MKGSREAIENDDLRTLRVKRMELPIGDLVFPFAAPEDQGGEPSKLDDQECVFPSKDQGVLAVDGEVYTDGRDPLAPWEEELVKLRQRSSEPVYVPDEEKPPHDEGLPGGTSSPSDRGGRGSSTDKPGSDSKPKPSTSSHDPFTMPEGKPVPEGYNWDGIRLVRNKKGSKRPPDTASEEWRNMSRNQREADVERYQAKLKREAAAGAEEERDAAPAMCQHDSVRMSPIALRSRPYTGKSWVRTPVRSCG